ncbi:MAG TPA: TraB/GumN family protein [Bacteroidales bacterium]|nr:TraB/GumN family protein [Bacteroidales bacterium]
MKKSILLVLVFLVGISSFSQSLLWKVSGKKMKTPSYIYGTIHIQDKRVFSYDQTVTDAFESCDAFAMEILMDELDQEEIKDAMLMKDNSLDKLLTSEQYKILDSIVKVSTGSGILMYNKMKPFFLSSQLMQMNMSQDMDLALDLYFLNKAREAGKMCFGVEEFADQIDAIDAISLEEQAEMLFDGLTDTTVNNDMEQLDEMLAEYMNFNLEHLFDMTNDTALPAEFNKAFLIDRNVGMVNSFVKISKKHSLFCAVGAAHLPGETGIIELLRKKGYTVEPVIFTWIKE